MWGQGQRRWANATLTLDHWLPCKHNADPTSAKHWPTSRVCWLVLSGVKQLVQCLSGMHLHGECYVTQYVDTAFAETTLKQHLDVAAYVDSESAKNLLK